MHTAPCSEATGDIWAKNGVIVSPFHTRRHVMFSSSRLESLDTTGVHWVNSFPPWNSRMVMWIRKCHQNPKIQFWANCPFKEDTQRPARRGKRRDELLRDLSILILKPNRRHHHTRRREMSNEERQAADSEGELSSSLSPWLFNEAWAHVPPKRKYKETSLKMKCCFFFTGHPPRSLLHPDSCWSVGRRYREDTGDAFTLQKRAAD